MHWTRLEDLNVSRICLEALIIREQQKEEQAAEPGPEYVNQDR